ncbi:SAM-dependent methyltransferase [Goodfellowiella coeruleoviolacea]|uniref:S-adenosyl methyltransferase n=1 Tax=Goodfellowiella coeruleoviolacea TaxID=334858 RepID=A0AAE3GDK2_9PSEU|nr:SAM-dependent methyltransferase [Goodfellowiella coeruleoviolacea]MCP2166331.1 S-adenosyl methyltransferase [Goodfellowiella coeruleoviolacea]
METWPTRLPKGVDINQPSAARVYDYYLGGACNFAADRDLARRAAEAVPWVRDLARANRSFLGRVVRFMVESGIRQFLDIGSGVPTLGNVHEIAQSVDPSCRVVYVDNEPVAVAHSELLLEGNELATVVQGDLRDPDGVLGDARTTALLDFDEPIGLLMVALLHFLRDDEDPAGIIERYRRRLAPGSFFALSHGTADVFPERMGELVEFYRSSSNPVTLRGKAEVERLFTGFDLVEPGLVWTAQWRPEFPENVGEHPERCAVYAGVGVKAAGAVASSPAESRTT